MNFENPTWFWALLIIPISWIVKSLLSRRRNRALQQFLAPRLRNQLIPPYPPGRIVALMLYSVGLALLITTAARPLGKELTQKIKVESRSILLLVDVSKSMLAPDVPPSRLARAKLIGMDLLEEFPEDRFGIIAFAGTPYLIAPLTTDHSALRETLEQIDIEVIPRGGTNLTLPIEMALETLKKHGPGRHGIIMLSDGAELEGESYSMAELAKAQNVSVFTVGIGTKLGARIPDPYDTGGYVLDETGEPVVAKLDDTVLKELASRTSGSYFHAGQSGLSAAALRQAVERLDQTMSKDTTITRREELYQWPLSFAVLFLALGVLLEKFGLKWAAQRAMSASQSTQPSKQVRTMQLSTWIIFLLTLVGIHGASIQSALAYDPLTALNQGRYEAAIRQYRELAHSAPTPDQRSQAHYGAGMAAYLSGNYVTANDEFSEALIQAPAKTRALARLGLGNTHFILGYDEALEIIEAFGIGQDIQLKNDRLSQGDSKTERLEFRQFLESFKHTLRPDEPVAPDAFGQLPRKLNATQMRQGLQMIDTRIDRALAILSEGIPHLRAAVEFSEIEDEALFNLRRSEKLKKDLEDLKKQLRQELDEQDPPPPPPQNQQGDSESEEPSEGEEEGEGDQPSNSSNPNSQDSQSPDANSNPSDPSDTNQDGQSNSPQDNQNPSQNGEDGMPPETGQAPEGKLEAQRRGESKPDPNAPASPNKDQQRDDETGFSPEEARNKLQQFSDELPMSLGQPPRPRPRRPFKDW